MSILRSKSYFYKIFTITFLVGFLISAVAASYVYNRTTYYINREISNQNNHTAELSMTVLRNAIRYATLAGLGLYNDPLVSRFLNGGVIDDALDLYSIRQSISGYSLSQDYVAGIYALDFSNSRQISTRRPLDIQTIKNQISSFEHKSGETIIVDITSYDNGEQPSLIQPIIRVIVSSDFRFESIDSAIIIDLLVEPLLNEVSENVRLIDSNSRIWWLEQGLWKEGRFESLDRKKTDFTILSFPEKTPERFIGSLSTGTIGGLSTIALRPISSVDSIRKTASFGIMAISIVFLLCAGILSIIFSRIIYKPIRSLVGHLQFENWIYHAEQRATEIELLSYSLYGDPQAFRSEKNISHPPLLHETVVRAYILNQINTDSVKRWMVSHPSKVSYILITPRTLDPVKMETIRQYLVSKTDSIIEWYNIVQIESGIIILLGDAESDSFTKCIRTIIDQIESVIPNLFLIYQEKPILWERLHGSYTESKTQLHSLIFTKKKVSIPTIFEKKESSSSTTIDYSITIERHILEALHLGQKERFETLIERFLHSLPFEDYHLCRRWCLRLAMSIEENNYRINCSAMRNNLVQEFDAIWEISQLKEWFVFFYMQNQELKKKTKNSILETTDQKEQIGKMSSTLRKDFTNPDLSIEALADQCGVSAGYFSRLFKQETGINPSYYLIHIRMEHACYLLRNTQKPIDKIAFECGYRNSNYFYQVFKKYAGITPNAYRNTLKNHEEN